MFSNVYVPPGGPPQVSPPDTRIHSIMGTDNIFALLRDFYKELSQSEISNLFPTTPEALEEAADKSACFFTGLFGGPPLFHKLHGPPMLRKRHMPWAIDENAKEIWVKCFKKTLENSDKYQFPQEYLPGFITFLEGFSGWMINKAPQGES
jgi:hemoglobin